MTNEKNPEVDPRFDAAFQRGFDPSIPIEEYVPPPSRPVAAAATPAPTTPAPAVSESGAPAIQPSEESQAVRYSEAASPTEDRMESSADLSTARNPFLLVIGVIAVALVGAGIWLFVRSGEAFNSRQVRSQGDYMSLDSTIHAAPFLALLGGATAIGLLFVFALRYRRRR